MHWDGLFQFGAPDRVIVNVTKEAIWTRKAALPESGNFARPSPREAVELFDLSPTKTEVTYPESRNKYEDLVEQAGRDQEIDPKKYYPLDVYRERHTSFPKGLKIDVAKMFPGGEKK